jgi:hypothetical protein
MPFSKPLYFDNILHKKAGPSRKNITKHIADTCGEANKSLLDIVDENKIIDGSDSNIPYARQIAEAPSADLKRRARSNDDYFACRLSRPSATIFTESNAKPFVISYRGRFCTGSRLSSLDTKHEVTPHNPSYFSPYAYMETIILPADDTTAGMLSTLTSRSATPDLSTFGKLYATPISERIHLSFEYTDETSTYERPTLCSCLIAEAIILIRKKKPTPSIQVFHIKNNVISHRYTLDIPQKETPQMPHSTRDEASKILAQYEHFLTSTAQGLILNQDGCSTLVNPAINYASATDYASAIGTIGTTSLE